MKYGPDSKKKLKHEPFGSNCCYENMMFGVEIHAFSVKVKLMMISGVEIHQFSRLLPFPVSLLKIPPVGHCDFNVETSHNSQNKNI